MIIILLNGTMHINKKEINKYYIVILKLQKTHSLAIVILITEVTIQIVQQ